MIQENISLKPYNTFGIDAVAKGLATFSNLEQLEEVLKEAEKRNYKCQLVLGGGSNILLTGDFDGLVLKNEIDGIEVVAEDADFIYVKGGAGEVWHHFVLHCLEKGYAGIENLSLIPGNIGASPMQNIGAYGVEIKDVFHQLEAYHIGDKTIQLFNTADCRFGYRESVFKNIYKGQYIILSVIYKLLKKPRFNTSYGAIQQELDNMGVKDLSIQAISQAVINIRSSKLPDWKLVGNAGSFFKNPTVDNDVAQKLKETFPKMVSFPFENGKTKLAAGWLIEQCGWKGYRKGDAGCYDKQALVLVNYGHATGAEIYAISEQIIQSVNEKFGVTLEREVNII